MREFMGPDVLANLVSMLRAEIEGAILLSNRDTDAKFLELAIDKRARVVAANHLALDVLSGLKERGVDGVAACASRNASSVTVEDVFQFELGDSLCLLISSSCTSKVLENVGGRPWFAAVERRFGDLTRRCAALSNVIDELQIESGIPGTVQREDLVNWSTLELLGPVIEKVFGTGAILTLSDRWDRVTDPLLPTKELLRIGNATEITKLLVSSLHRLRPNGLPAEQRVSLSEFCRLLHMAFEIHSIEDDKIFWQMKKWEISNPGFPLLRQWREQDSFQIVLNQRYWESDLRTFLGEGNEYLMSIIKLDLDNFKSVNETLGHMGGDEAIKLACQTIKDVVANNGFVYRRGGDEMVVLAPGMRDDVALRLCERLRERIEAEFATWGANQGLSAPPTASIGLVTTSCDKNFEEVIAAVDCAQLNAKNAGKNCVIVESVPQREAA